MADELLKIEEHITDGSVADVLQIARSLIAGETMSIEVIEKTIKKLAGYSLYIGATAGLYKGERSRIQYLTIKDGSGTAKDKEAQGKSAAAVMRTRQEVFGNMFKALLSSTDAMRDIFREHKKDYRMNYNADA